MRYLARIWWKFHCKLNFRCATIDICTKGVQIIFVQCSTCIRPIPWHTCCFLNKKYFQIFFANIDCRSTESLFATKLSQYTRKISQIMNILKIFSNIIPILRIGPESQSRFFFWTTLYNFVCIHAAIVGNCVIDWNTLTAYR